MSSGMLTRNSLQSVKKWSIEWRERNTIAVWSRIDTFCWRNSFGVTPSTFIKEQKSICTLCFSARSKYGDFPVVGFGCETRILLTFNVLNFYRYKFTQFQYEFPRHCHGQKFKCAKVQKNIQIVSVFSENDSKQAICFSANKEKQCQKYIKIYINSRQRGYEYHNCRCRRDCEAQKLCCKGI